MKQGDIAQRQMTGTTRWETGPALSLAAAVLALLLLAAYHNSFSVPFLLDDASSITGNRTLRSFLTALFPPTDSGVTVSGRPLLNLTLAVNHRFGGDDVRGYHAGNLLIHFAGALCLFAVLRRILRLPVIDGRLRTGATPLAWFAAGLWALHPMQTESVTYIVQRAELLVGVCYLFTVYAFIRAVEEASRGWAVAAVAACFLGTTAKEVMATAPLVLLVLDRTFLSGSFREAWRRNGRLHLALASSWVLLLALVITSGGRGATVGFDSVAWHDYLLAQGPGIAGYLWHVFNPAALVFDYGIVLEDRPAVLFAGCSLVLALLGATAWSFVKRPAAAFPGVWFFLILAPTSSVVPVKTQLLAEHRMYLPLAAIAVAIVVAARLLIVRAWAMWGLLAVLVAACTVATIDRNGDYRLAVALWEDTVRKVPTNIRALNNLGSAFMEADRLDDAIACLQQAIRLAPDFADAHSNLGVAALRRELQLPADEEARQSFLERTGPAAAASTSPPDPRVVEQAFRSMQRAIELAPGNARLVAVHANARLDTGQIEAAAAGFERARALAPDDATYDFDYANALVKLGRFDEAEARFAAALRLEPDQPDILTNFGALLRTLNRHEEAIALLRRAVAAKPSSARVRSNLGVSLLAAGRRDEGIEQLREAVRLNPGLPQARYYLGLGLAETGATAEAIAQFEVTSQLAAPTDELLVNLGVLYARIGRYEEAAAQFERALEINPGDTATRENLAKLRVRLQRADGAR